MPISREAKNILGGKRLFGGKVFPATRKKTIFRSRELEELKVIHQARHDPSTKESTKF